MSDQNSNPGDQAEPGTPGTGEHDATPCPVSGGTGKVNEGIGGAFYFGDTILNSDHLPNGSDHPTIQ